MRAYQALVTAPAHCAEVRRIVVGALDALPAALAEECQHIVELHVHTCLATRWGHMREWRREADRIAVRRAEAVRENVAEYYRFVEDHPDAQQKWQRIAECHVPRSRFGDWDRAIYDEISDALRLQWKDVKQREALARKIARRKAWKLRMEARREHDALVQKYWDTPLTDPGPHPADVMAEPEEKAMFKEGIKELSQSDQTIINAYIQHGSIRKAAQSLKKAEATYRRRLRAILKRLP